MKNKAIVCVGIPCSGKSHFAKDLCKSDPSYTEVNRDFIRFNVVCPNSDWSSYKFTNKREKEVTDIQHQMIIQAFYDDQNVIVSDTNLNPKTRQAMIDLLEEYDFEVEIKEFPITLEEAYKRDAQRGNGVGQSVIYSMYQKWLQYKDRKTYIPDESKPKAVIVDLDGTVADMNGKRGPFEWNKVGGDITRPVIVDMIKGYDTQGYVILAVSGRDGVCFDDTKNWLTENDIPHFYLFMRKQGDTRKDSVVKEEIFWQHIAGRYNVVACVDDRPQMVRLWHELKIPNVICVADPYVEF